MLVECFQNRRMSPPRLCAFGFVPAAGGYVYTTDLLDGHMQMTVTVSGEGDVNAHVEDTASGEEYVLHLVPGACGSFVGRVRAEYEAVLRRVADECFERDVFRGEQAKRLIAYVRETYHGELEYLWERFPTNAIWRRADNAKWYGALLVVEKTKLGLPGNAGESVEILDVRADSAALVDGVRHLSGYHMNKAHWVTIPLDGSVPMAEICQRLDESYVAANGSRAVRRS